MYQFISSNLTIASDNGDEFESSALLSSLEVDQNDIEEEKDEQIINKYSVFMSSSNKADDYGDNNNDDIYDDVDAAKQLLYLQQQQSSVSFHQLIDSNDDDDISSILGSITSRTYPSINNQQSINDGIDNHGFNSEKEEEEEKNIRRQVGMVEEDKQYLQNPEMNCKLSKGSVSLSYRTRQEQLQFVGHFFEINNKFELGDMCELFLSSLWVNFFFASIIIYLLGDLLIYNTMLAKSTREVTW